MSVKRFLILPALAVTLLGAFGLSGGGDASAQASAITVRVGDGEPGYAVTQFLPSNVTVPTGATVTFKFGWFEVHHVALFEGAEPPPGEPADTPSPATFPNTAKYVFSGDINGDPAKPTLYNIKFTKAGTYAYHCFIHPRMDATVQVVDPGSAASGNIDNQQSADARGNAQYKSALVNIKDIKAGIKPGPDASKPGGAKTVENVAGLFTPGLGQALSFAPAVTSIREGDSVKWVERDGAPHNIVIGRPAPADPFAYQGPKSGSVYNGTGDFQSPVFAGRGDFGPDVADNYEIVFSKAGTYNYICLLHVDQGMAGQIVVTARGGAPLPPNTGSSFVADDESSATGWLVVIGAALLAVGIGGASTVRARR